MAKDMRLALRAWRDNSRHERNAWARWRQVQYILPVTLNSRRPEVASKPPDCRGRLFTMTISGCFASFQDTTIQPLCVNSSSLSR